MQTHTGLNLGEPTGALSPQRNAAPGKAGPSNTGMQSQQPLQHPLSPPATQQNQPTTQPPAQQNHSANQLPTQQNQPNSLPPTGPITPAGGNRQPTSGPQAVRPAAGGNDPINPEITPPIVGPTPQSQADEIQALKA
ncbi:hypothetical protein L208DRAFT_1379979 [Tricholoma matsutake]|nr:hypothetical protein L208DRAFT_1379979 [Tricholoma matsutake 945]